MAGRKKLVPDELLSALKRDYEDKVLSLKEVAAKYGLSRSALKVYVNKGGWKKRKAAPKPKDPAALGRPSKYDRKYLSAVTQLCMIGYLNGELAEFLGVSEKTFYEYKRDHVEFREAIVKGRETASRKVVTSLFRRICGYEYEEVKETYESPLPGSKTPPILMKREKTTKHYPPDVRAALSWLRAKFPDIWSESHRIEAAVTPAIGKITAEDVQAIKTLFDELTE